MVLSVEVDEGRSMFDVLKTVCPHIAAAPPRPRLLGNETVHLIPAHESAQSVLTNAVTERKKINQPTPPSNQKIQFTGFLVYPYRTLPYVH